MLGCVDPVGAMLTQLRVGDTSWGWVDATVDPLGEELG